MWRSIVKLSNCSELGVLSTLHFALPATLRSVIHGTQERFDLFPLRRTKSFILQMGVGSSINITRKWSAASDPVMDEKTLYLCGCWWTPAWFPQIFIKSVLPPRNALAQDITKLETGYTVLSLRQPRRRRLVINAMVTSTIRLRFDGRSTIRSLRRRYTSVPIDTSAAVTLTYWFI